MSDLLYRLNLIASSKFYETVDLIKKLLTTPEDMKAFYDRLEKDLAYFAKVVRGDIIKGEVPDHHKRMFKFLQNDKVFKAIVCFRSAGKTFTKTTDLLHDICHQLESVIYMISDTEGQAIKDLIEIKQEIEGNEVLKYIYGNLRGKSPWGVTQLEFSNGVYLSVRGTGSAIRGTKWKNARLSKVVMDDFESEQNSDNENKRERLQDWIDAQVMPAGGEFGSYKVYFYGTIVNEEAFLAKANPKENKDSLFQGQYGDFIKVDITYIDEVTGEEKPSWEDMRGWDYIKFWKDYYTVRKRLWFFFQEYYNIPASKSNPVLQMDKIVCVNAVVRRFGRFTWLEAYKDDDIGHLNTPVLIPLNVYIGIDPSVKAGANSDDTVFFTVGLTPTGKFIILDIVAEKIPIEEQPLRVINYLDIWTPTHATIETYAYQLSLLSTVQKDMRNSGKPHVVFPFNENKSKSNKYKDGLIGPINNSQFSYIKGCPNISKFIEQGKKFSGGVTPHDDTLDGCFLAIVEDDKLGKVLFPPYNIPVGDTLARLKLAKAKKMKKGKNRYNNFMSR